MHVESESAKRASTNARDDRQERETTTVAIPVTVTLWPTVEIGVAVETDKNNVALVSTDDSSDRKNLDALNEAIIAAGTDDTVMQALENLLTAVQYHRRENGHVRCTWTPFRGVVEEREF